MISTINRSITYLSIAIFTLPILHSTVYAQESPLHISTHTISVDYLYPIAFTASPIDIIHVKHDIARSVPYQWQNPDSALYYLRKALNRSLQSGYYDGAAQTEINMGLVFMGHGDFKTCFQHYNRAYRYALKAFNSQELISTLFVNIGVTYSMQENHEQAFKYYYSVLQYMLKLNPRDRNIIMAYNNIADALLRMEQYDKAAYYLDVAEKLISKLGIPSLYCYVWANQAEVSFLKGDLEKAEQLSSKALTVARTYKNPEAEQALYVFKGRLHLKRSEPREAIDFFNKALKITTATYPFYSMINPLYYLGYAYYETGEYHKAEQALTLALNKAAYTGIRAEQLKALHTLASIYEKESRLKEALTVMHSYNTLKDTILNKEKLDATNQMEVKYRTAQKDKELIQKELLLEKKDRDIEHKNNLITGVALGIGLLFISGVALYRNFKHKSKINTLKARIEGEEIERSRIAMELHDGGGGMLAAIKMIFSEIGMGAGKEYDILNLLNATSEEVRKTAHNLMPIAVQNFGLKEALTQFCQSIKESKKLDINLQCNSELQNIKEPSVKLSIYRIVQECIHNIIKHAHASSAIIQVFEQKGILHMLIEDNGIGFNANKIFYGQGFSNLESRVKALQGTINIESAEGFGTTINIELNLSAL